MHKLLQLPCLNQLVQEILQGFALFGSVTLVLMVVVIQALISPHGISFHLFWLFEVRFILNLLQHMVNWLLEYQVYYLNITPRRLVKEFPPQPRRLKTIWPKVLSILWEGLCLLFTLNLVNFHSFIFLYPLH